MLHTHTNTHGHEPFPKILERIALPLLLFTAVLFVLLFISWFKILPRFTYFKVSDVSLSPTEMATYAKQMKAQLQTAEETRDRLVLPIIDPGYDVLKEQKRSMTSILEIRAMLQDTALHLKDTHAVAITHLSYDMQTGIVAFSGDVSGVGPRSMTVLAHYVEALEALERVSDLERPAFTRAQNEDGTFHSPFAMQFILQSISQ